MYIKLYYKKEENKEVIKNIRAVDRFEKPVELDLTKFYGTPITDGLKKQVSHILKGYFVTNWVRE